MPQSVYATYNCIKLEDTNFSMAQADEFITSTKMFASYYSEQFLKNGGTVETEYAEFDANGYGSEKFIISLPSQNRAALLEVVTRITDS